MITWQKFDYAEQKDSTPVYYGEGTCLALDNKPTENIANGSKLLEMDTATLYMFDAQNKQWRPWT